MTDQADRDAEWLLPCVPIDNETHIGCYVDFKDESIHHEGFCPHEHRHAVAVELRKRDERIAELEASAALWGGIAGKMSNKLAESVAALRDAREALHLTEMAPSWQAFLTCHECNLQAIAKIDALGITKEKP